MTAPIPSRFKPVLQKRRGLALGVWGEAGVGKSHQVRELLQTLPCKNLSLHATTPLATLAQTLPRPKKLPLWAENNLKRLANGEAVETSSTLDSLGAALAGLAPFVFHLEDIHEANQERLNFIQELARVVSRMKGVALIVTSRREPPEPFATVKLEPLSKEEADTLLETDLKNTLPSEALKWIYDKSAGNPLYSLEYLRYLTRQGLLWNDGKRWHWRNPPKDAMPVTVEALIEQLLNQAKTEPLQRYVIETRAFLPFDSSDEVWQKVARVNERDLQAAVTELTQRGIFKQNDFAHPLFREVTLRTLSPERKRNLARRAINVLEHQPERAAMFVEEAGLERTQALELLKKAAGQVSERNELNAARFLAKAVNYAEGEEKTELALRAAEGLRSHDMPAAVQLAEHTLALEPSNLAAKVLLAKLYALQHRKEEAKAMFGQLPSQYRASKEGLETLIEVYNRCEDYSVVVNAFKEQAANFSPLSTTVISFVMGSLTELSRYEEVEELAARTLEGLEPTSWAYVSVLHALAFMHLAANQYKKAESEFRQAATLIEHHHSGRRLHVPLYNRALALMWLGRFDEAKVDAERARALALAAGDVIQYACTTSLSGVLEHEVGHYEFAEELLLEVQTTLAYRSPSQHFLDIYSDLTLLYLEWQGPATNPMLALKYGRTNLGLARDFGVIYRVDSLAYLAMAESSFGNPHYALELAEEAQTIAAGAKMPKAKFTAAEAKGAALQALQRFDEARLEFLHAEGVGRELGLGVYTEKVGLKLDRLNNDVESARRRMQWFEERGLINGVNIAKRYFPELAGKPAQAANVHHAPRLEVLGGMQVSHEGETEKVRGAKRQEFLALLLEARLSGRPELSRLELFDSLYPEDDERKAAHALKVLVHDIRSGFGANILTTTANGYALGECSLDAEVFLQTLDTLLWRGTYLEDLDLAEESNVRDALYTALFEKAKTLLELGPQEATRVGSILVEAEPYNTDYLKLYLAALRLSKKHGKLTRYYQEARKRLLEVGETLPDTWQNFLD